MFGLAVYCTWGFAHELCYNQIDKRFHQRAAAIGLMFAVSFLDVLLVIIWYQAAIAVGPGRLPKVPPYMILPEDFSIDRIGDPAETAHSLVPPVCYQSCPRGNPIWCSACDSVKTERAHHSSDMEYCVPRFDHKCAWLGAVIGRDNYRFFIQFVMYMAILSLFVFVPICAFIRRIIHDGDTQHSLNPNLIVILIIAVFAWLMTTSMLVTHTVCIVTNTTSVEVMARRDDSSFNRTVCYYSFKAGMRYVVQLKNNELHSLWRKKDLWLNMVDFLGSNMLLWFLPLRSNDNEPNQDLEEMDNKVLPLQRVLGHYYEPFSDETIDLIEKKIANNDYLTTLHAYGDRYI